MKRLLAVFLSLATIISLAVMIPGSATGYEESPFYMVNVMGPRYVDFPENIDEMPQAVLTPIKAGDTKITITLFDTTDIPTMAQKLKEEFDSRPEGMRYLNFPLCIEQQAEHMIYMDKTVALFKAWIKTFFTEYKRIDGRIDGMVFYTEYPAISAYYISGIYERSVTIRDAVEGTSATFPQNKNIYSDIVSDSRYATQVRPYLEERGFRFSTPNGDKSEIYPISDSTGAESAIWDAVMRNRMCKYLNEACAPFTALYPYADVSNYRFSGSNRWNEDSVLSGGNTMYAGNTANESFYLSKRYADAGNGYIPPVAYNGAVYEDTAYNAFLYEVNTFKDMHAASGNKNISAWIAGFNYLASKERPDDGIAYSPYYAEALFHIGMLNPQPFLGHVIAPRDTDQNEDAYNYIDVMRNISEILKELTRVAGYADRKPISVPKTWNSNFVISGMYAGGRNIWRITPNTSEGASVEAFKVKNQAPTFAIDGETIIFPQGRIIENSKIYATGTCGYWIETPANVTPIVITDAKRYENNPAYEENFETYKVGTTFSNTTARHSAAWTVSNNTAAVQAQNGGKALEITGTITIQNVKIPQNITAADSYAKQQAWEVTVTVPSSGELKILSCAENDGGIRIAGGKVYYNGNTELASVTAGNTYIITREVDFRNADAFTSTYTVRNANGTQIAQKAGVAMETVAIPVSSISFAGTDVDKAYIDNYRLRATGVATELSLYEADTGMPIADTTAATTENAVYRLSWYNASGNYQVAKIYNNGALLHTVEMPSGADSFATGLVAEGSQLTVTVEKGTAPKYPDYDGEAFDWLPEPIVIPETTAPVEGTGDANDTAETTIPSTTGNANSTTAPTTPVTPDAGKKGLSGGAIALIVIGSLLVLAGGGFVLCWFVLKPKWLMDLNLNKAAWQVILQTIKSKCLTVLEFFKALKKK